MSDKWGPKSNADVLGKQFSGFMKHQQVDSKEVTVVLTKAMLNTYIQNSVYLVVASFLNLHIFLFQVHP